MRIFEKKLTDLVYLTFLKIRKFKKNNKSKVVAYGATKYVAQTHDDIVKRGVKWITASRGTFILADDGIYLNNNRIIDLREIESANIQYYRSGMIFKVNTTDGMHHLFGLQYIKELINQDIIDYGISDDSVKYSKFSIFIRAALVVFILLFIKDVIISLLQ